MKLSKIYANKSFKNIEFNTENGGFNVIYADVKTKTSDKGRFQHNLGKSRLVELIDFLMLKGVDKELFLIKHQQFFIEYEFYLEILLNSGKYLTIKRSVKNNSKISFRLHEEKQKDYKPFNVWTNKDLTIDKAKEKLNEYLNFDLFNEKKYIYRSGISYSLRLTNGIVNDYLDVFQLSKFQKGNHKSWKPFMFDLLGFDGAKIYEKYTKEDEISQLKKLKQKEEKDFQIKSEEKDAITGKIDALKSEKEKLGKELDSFNFYNQDKKLISQVVEDIEFEISNLNTQAYNLDFDVNKIRQSLQNDFSFDWNFVKQIFEETQIHFSNQLAKNYEQLVDFNKSISTERVNLLHDTLKKITEQQKEVQHKLKELNEKRSELLSFIQDTTIFKKYKTYQKDLIKIEGEIVRLESQFSAIDIIRKKETEIKSKTQEVKNLIEDIKSQIDNSLNNKTYTSIRKIFRELVTKILSKPAIISLKINSKDNIEFKCDVQDLIKDTATAEDEGATFKKLLCAAFDLAILIQYSKQSYFRFVYHDDIFSNLSNKLKNNYLDIVKGICIDYDIQYIFTIIKDDLPRNEIDMPIDFADNEKILVLHDKDNTGKLFGFEF